jgi:hypothetical protein
MQKTSDITRPGYIRKNLDQAKESKFFLVKKLPQIRKPLIIKKHSNPIIGKLSPRKLIRRSLIGSNLYGFPSEIGYE